MVTTHVERTFLRMLVEGGGCILESADAVAQDLVRLNASKAEA